VRAAGLLLLAGCTYPVLGTAFRTREGSTAFERAVQAVETRCHGVRFTNAEAGIVTGHWQAFHTREGVFLGRCQVSVFQQADEVGAEVRVAVTMKQCPLSDLADLDALGDTATCQPAFAIPGEAANGQNEAVRQVEADVRR